MMLLARFLSFVSNPFFILASAPYLLVLKTTQDSIYALKWTLFTLAFVLATVLFVLFGIAKGFFVNVDISKREQRPAFFIFSACAMLLYLFSLLMLHGPLILLVAVLSLSLGLLLVSFLNTKIKVSLHVAMLTSFLMAMAILFKEISLLGLLFIPVIGWSRIVTKRHTSSEVITGALLGVILTVFSFILINEMIKQSILR